MGGYAGTAWSSILPQCQAAQDEFWDSANDILDLRWLNGHLISDHFMTFTGASVARVFFITAGTFAGMSLWAYTTKKICQAGAHSFSWD